MGFLKKRFKRVTSMGLALLLSASALPSTAFASSDSTLAEVTAKYIDAENGKEIVEPETYSVTHEEKSPQEIENYTYVDYAESVEYIYSHKDLTYIIGYPDESVRPDASMTRAEAATVFYRLYDGEYPEFERRMSNGTFEDVKTDCWFYKEVETLYNIGIVDGTDEHKFSPDAPVTITSSSTSGHSSKARTLRSRTVSPPRSKLSLSNPIRVEEPAATRTAVTRHSNFLHLPHFIPALRRTAQSVLLFIEYYSVSTHKLQQPSPIKNAPVQHFWRCTGA